MRSDYFLSYRNFYKRLKDDFEKHGRIIIAYDFDDTVSNFSQCKYEDAMGLDNCKIVKLLQDYREYAYFILFTARSTEKSIEEAVDYLHKNNIPLDSVNKNMPGLPFGSQSKVYYNILLDDKAGLGWPYRALKRLLRYIRRYNKWMNLK